MRIALIVAAALLAVPVVVLILSARKYGRLLGDEHLTALLASLPGLRRAALDRVGDPVQHDDDPRVARTAAGVVVTYSIDRDDAGFVHRVSYSHRGGRIALAAAGRFLYMTLTTLGLLDTLATVGQSAGGVVHATCRLTPDAHRSASELAVVPPHAGQWPELRRAASSWLNDLRRAGRIERAPGGRAGSSVSG